MDMRRSPILAILLTSLISIIVVGCSKNSEVNPVDGTNSVSQIDTFTESQLQQKQRAESTRDQMLSTLLDELVSAIGENGPAKSIKVCKVSAPAVAKQLSQDGIKIGRTSFKLRNPANQPPEWAASFVTTQTQEPTFVALPQDRLGALLPIRLKATCLMCHGTEPEILPEVKAAIVSNYPKDQATGFAEGDLRGYFWVEVD